MVGGDYPFDMGNQAATDEVLGASIPESERRAILGEIGAGIVALA